MTAIAINNLAAAADLNAVKGGWSEVLSIYTGSSRSFSKCRPRSRKLSALQPGKASRAAPTAESSCSASSTVYSANALPVAGLRASRTPALPSTCRLPIHEWWTARSSPAAELTIPAFYRPAGRACIRRSGR